MLEEPSGHLSISLNSNMPSPHRVLASFSKNEENWTVLVLSHGCTLKGPKEIFFLMPTPLSHPDQRNQNPWRESPETE